MAKYNKHVSFWGNPISGNLHVQSGAPNDS